MSNVQPATDALYTYGVTSSGILFFTHGLNLFVYLAFNKIFREVLYGYLKFKFMIKTTISIQRESFLDSKPTEKHK